MLVDARGTGTSSFINCPGLESLQGDYIENIRLCGEQLGNSSDLYGTAFAADDLAAVLDALAIDRIDLYGDSYGTFFGQSFAIRHPDRVRTLTLDAAYPVEDQDPWYPDLNRAMRDAFRLVCERDPGCAALGGDVIDRLAALANALRADPLAGQAYDGDGVLRDVEVDASFLSYLEGVATYGTTVYEELDGAGRAWLEGGDPAPLLRIAAEQTDWTEVGDTGGVLLRPLRRGDLQRLSATLGHRRAVRRPPSTVRCVGGRASRTDADAFAPFTVDDWLASPWTEFESCIKWPAPDPWVPPVDSPATYPAVPTLVLVGDLDSITSSEGSGSSPIGSRTRRSSKSPTPVMSPRITDYRGARPTSSSSSFAPSLRATRVARRSTRRCARPTSSRCASATSLRRRIGLGSATPRRVGGHLDGRRRVPALVRDARVGRCRSARWHVHHDRARQRALPSRRPAVGREPGRVGRVEWNRATGGVAATVTCAGAAECRLTITWNYNEAHAIATVTGRIDGPRVSITLPAP